jgi:hypothetical protein
MRVLKHAGSSVVYMPRSMLRSEEAESVCPQCTRPLPVHAPFSNAEGLSVSKGQLWMFH